MVVQIPNKEYWAIFYVANPAKIHIPAMFILKTDAMKWAKEQGYGEDEVMFKKIHALVSVM